MTDPVTSDDDDMPPPSRAWVRWTGAVIVLALVLGAAGPLLVSRGDDRPHPEEVLAAAQAALDAQGRGIRFSAQVERTVPEGPDGAGGSATSTSSEVGEWAGGVSHVVADRDPWAVETVVTPDLAYVRSATPASEITPATPWNVVHDPLAKDFLEVFAGAGVDPPVPDAAAIVTAQELYLSGGDPDAPRAWLPAFGTYHGDLVGVDPGTLVEAMGRLGTPEWDGDALTATLRAPDEWVEAYGAPLPDARAELAVGDDGLPARYRLHIDAGDLGVTIDVTFEAWGAPLTIDVPEVDDTVAAAGDLAAAGPGSVLRARASRRR